MTNLRAVNSKWLLQKASVAGTISEQARDLKSQKTFNMILRGTGAVSAVVLLEGSNLPDDDTFVTLVTLNISSTDGTLNPAKESGIHEAPWAIVRYTLVSISGMNATVDAAVGN